MPQQDQNSPIIEFVPNGQGMLVLEPQPPALPPAAHARAMTAARLVLHALDSNADGRLTGEEAGSLTHLNTAQIVAQTRAELRAHNAGIYPWLARDSEVIDDAVVLNSDLLVTAMRNNTDLGQLRRQDLHQAIREALPYGVDTVTLSQECRNHPELPCLPAGNRVMVHLDGPTI